MAKEKFSSMLTVSDLFDDDTLAVTAGKWARVGEYEVAKGEEVAIGFGQYDDQERAVGRLYAKLMDDTDPAVEEAGLLRLSVYSPADRPLKILWEGRTNVAGASTTRSEQIALPENAVNVREDQKIVLEFKPDSSDTIVKADSTILIDVTKYVI